ncbi:MAG: dTMP kinase, partial [Undibacterium sp.]|nr:dTMP kinase [Undibacterium sp.]
WVHPHLQPDITLLFDVPLEVARTRLDATRDLDKFEKEQEVFFANTRAEYLRRAAEFPNRFRVIDSTRSIPEIQREINGLISALCDGNTNA